MIMMKYESTDLSKRKIKIVTEVPKEGYNFDYSNILKSLNRNL